MTRSLRASTPDAAPPDELDITQFIDGIAGLLGGAANVIMQLSTRPVGYGVLESTVDSGNVMLHPVKRLRTTITYLAVAMLGTDAERADYRDAVNRSHRPVHSTASSPVRYNAFDPDLQLWVAACLYWGAQDTYTWLHGPMDEATADAFYRHSARLGTTLQVRPDMWPADRKAFAAYWDRQLARTTIDPPIRDYFHDLVDLKMLPLPLRLPFARIHRFFVTGLLPEHLRDQMGFTWSARDDRALARVLRTLGTAETLLPRPARLFPVNAYLLDFRLRRKLGLRLV
ncbi:oxygenase MpaB family protein [Nocardia suismassiliense]|uniref:oxygenase MpaB family protein n=1 Tax=Nocardia suismassiliense TaxID=2077092 RepID=UPI000D1D82C4|nr:oxygenase MpaB family protein [Nocardia suismassiliense]